MVAETAEQTGSNGELISTEFVLNCCVKFHFMDIGLVFMHISIPEHNTPTHKTRTSQQEETDVSWQICFT